MPNIKVFGMSNEIRKNVERALLVLSFLMIAISFFLVRKEVLDGQVATPPPLDFRGDWISDRQTYRPGELARFTYVREVSFRGEKSHEIALLGIDVFENQDTNEVYNGAILARVIESEGVKELHSVRRIPADISPGRYILAGWMSAQTPRRTLPAAYKSNVFTVVEQSPKLP